MYKYTLKIQMSPISAGGTVGWSERLAWLGNANQNQLGGSALLTAVSWVFSLGLGTYGTLRKYLLNEY